MDPEPLGSGWNRGRKEAIVFTALRISRKLKSRLIGGSNNHLSIDHRKVKGLRE